MKLNKMPAHHLTFGKFKRKDNEEFEISATLWESPSYYDYWMVIYVANHKKWGDMRFTLILPKKIAVSVELATSLVGGLPLEQVKSGLTSATATGRDLIFCPSRDGWTLIG